MKPSHKEDPDTFHLLYGRRSPSHLRRDRCRRMPGFEITRNGLRSAATQRQPYILEKHRSIPFQGWIST